MTSTVGSAVAIRPFHVDVPGEALEDLRRRIAATNWPEKETVSDESQGVPLAMIQKLGRYWMTDYDWRACEASLNALPQFISEIETGSTSTSSTSARSTKTRCRSSSTTAGRARSSSS